MTKTNHYEICLSYYKQGDDLHYHLLHSGTPIEGLRAHAEMLCDAAEHLKEIALTIEEYGTKEGTKLEINADTHFIDISGTQELMDKLLEKGLIIEPDWDEEDEYNEDDCECCECSKCEDCAE